MSRILTGRLIVHMFSDALKIQQLISNGKIKLVQLTGHSISIIEQCAVVFGTELEVCNCDYLIKSNFTIVIDNIIVVGYISNNISLISVYVTYIVEKINRALSPYL